MRILLITPRLPYPPHRGDKLRTFNLLKKLSQRNSVHLISFVESKCESEHIRCLRPYCTEIDVVPLPRWRSFLQCFFGLFSDLPLQVHYFRSNKMRRLITETCAKSHYDVIHTHLIRMAQYTAFAGHIPKTLDLTDAGSLYLRRFLAHEKNPFKKFLLKIELDRIARYENILEKYDVCFVCAKPDEKAVRKAAPAANLAILPNSVDLDYFSSNGSVTYDQAGIVFTGNLTYYPNIDAVFFFVEEIFPLIKKALPAAKFYIVGQAPPAKVRALASDDVIVTGFVEDIRLYYLRSAVSVSPIRFGAGTLNKILEPLALGVPVVATSLAIQGLDLTVGKDVLTADHPQGFANEVVRVMKDSALRERLGKEGLATVRRLYNLDAIASSLENCYQEMAMKSHKVRRQEYWSPVE